MKRLRFIIPLLVLALISGCSPQPPNPETAVQEFWAAFKTGNTERAVYHIAEDADEVIEWTKHTIESTNTQEIFTEKGAKILWGRINLFTEGHKIENDTAIVQAVLELPNEKLLISKFEEKLQNMELTSMFLEGISDESWNDLLETTFLEILWETPDTQIYYEFELILIGGEWKITDIIVKSSLYKKLIGLIYIYPVYALEYMR